MANYSRGAVVLVNLGPVAGHEQDNMRPCAVLSDLHQIQACYPFPLYTIIPFTSAGYLSGALVPTIIARPGGLARNSTALIIQVRSVDQSRVIKQVGTLNATELSIIAKGLLFHFGLTTT